MIESFLEKIIEELGATGVLVVGLYWILHKPLNSMARHLKTINDELGHLIRLIARHQTKVEDPNGKD